MGRGKVLGPIASPFGPDRCLNTDDKSLRASLTRLSKWVGIKNKLEVNDEIIRLQNSSKTSAGVLC